MAAGLEIHVSNGRRGVVRAVSDWIADLGGLIIDWATGVGSVSLFGLRAMRWLLTHLPRKGTTLPAFYQIGVLSLPVVALTGTFIGMVLAVQAL